MNPHAAMKSESERGTGWQGGAGAARPASSRPALRVRNIRTDRAVAPELASPFLDDIPPEWSVLLNERREQIATALRSVGRIQQGSVILGTGFLVARNVVITARHVAESFSMDIDGVLKIRVGWDPIIDFDSETAPEEPAEHDGLTPHAHPPDVPSGGTGGGGHDHHHAACGCCKIRSVIYVHDTLDLALLRVSFEGAERPPDWLRPQPLKLSATTPVDQSRRVCLIGFPKHDETSTTADDRIFKKPLGVKRVQPGEVSNAPGAGREFQHDCSTLKGNSGSCVIDLETGKVIGLHFRGSREHPGQQGFNRAIAFWLLPPEDHLVLRQAGVELV